MRSKITTTIDSALEDEFRKAAAQVFGLKRGSLSEATAEAFQDFINKHKHD